MQFTKELKQNKLDNIINILRDDIDFVRDELNINCLTDKDKTSYGLKYNENISSHGYDRFAR